MSYIEVKVFSLPLYILWASEMHGPLCNPLPLLLSALSINNDILTNNAEICPFALHTCHAVVIALVILLSLLYARAAAAVVINAY